MNKQTPSRQKKELSFEEERALVERAKHDREAFGELYDLYFDRVYQYMYYRVGNHEDAEDLTARVFYRMLKALPRYEATNAPFGAWVFRIAHNLVANWHRDQKRRRFLSLDDLPLWGARDEKQEEHLERGLEQEEVFQLIHDLLQSLPEDRQTLLFLKFYAEMSNVEIGKVLGRTEGAVKALYNRTLRALRKQVQQRGVRKRPWNNDSTS